MGLIWICTSRIEESKILTKMGKDGLLVEYLLKLNREINNMSHLKWTIGDIIDLEYFFKKDLSRTDLTNLKTRDREIYIDFIRPMLHEDISLKEIDHYLPEDTEKSSNIREEKKSEKNFQDNYITNDNFRKNIIRLWLHEMRAKVKSAISHPFLFPGNFYEEIHKILKILFLILGILAGISLCTSFFSYTGTNPLNVAYFIAITVLPQIFLLTILSLSLFLTKQNIISKKQFGIYALTGVCVEKFMLWSGKKIFGKISGIDREKILTLLGIIREGHIVYGFLFFWPIFILFQLFAMGFNVGVLGSTLFHVMFFDTAFGWQSTVQVNAHNVYKIVSMIAAPWSWFIQPDIAFPGPAEIQGSRMILKDGILHLTTVNLVSWWPFLCFTVLFYGFLPRFILFLSANICLKRNLNSQKLNHGDCSKLIRRMIFPGVSLDSISGTCDTEKFSGSVKPSFSRDLQNFSHDLQNPMDIDKFSESTKDSLKLTGKAAVEFTALIPDDIYDQCDFEQLKLIVKNYNGCYLNGTKRVGINFNQDLESIVKIISENKKGNPHGFLLFYEAWQPPIREILKFIKNIRKAGDKEMPLIIALIGKPCETTIFTVVKEMDLKIWNMKIKGLGDPYIQIETLVKPAL